MSMGTMVLIQKSDPDWKDGRGEAERGGVRQKGEE